MTVFTSIPASLLFSINVSNSFPSFFSPVVTVAAVMILSSLIAICVYSQKRRYLSFCGQFSHLHLQRFVNVQCRHLRFLLIISVSLFLSDIGILLLHFQSHSFVFGSIQFHLQTHSMSACMGILLSWIPQFIKRILAVLFS